MVALPGQEKYIHSVHEHANSIPWPKPNQQATTQAVPTRLLSGDEAREMEPDLSPHISLALFSPETGIIDSHSLMDSFEQDIESSEGGELVFDTKVVRVDPWVGNIDVGEERVQDGGWVVQTLTSEGEETDSILAKTLINASGLSSHQILNHLLPLTTPPSPLIPIFYARGSYAAYRGPGVGSIQRLLYPVPDEGKSRDRKGTIGGHQGLGTHLTVDLDGNIRFGPDVEWIEPPGVDSDNVTDPSAIDFWQKHLVATESQLPLMHESISSYLPNITLEGLSPDYVGIRPKLAGPGQGFRDFVIRVDKSGRFVRGKREDEGGRMVTLMGIESPGLTSSMALAEMVVDDVL